MTEEGVVAPAPPRTRSSETVRTLAWSFVEFFALSGIAFAQPMLNLLTKNTGLFFTRGTTGPQTIVLTLLILVVPPAAALLIEALFAIVVPRSRGWVHGLLAGVFVGVIAIESVKKATSLGPAALWGIGVIAGVAGVLLVMRFDPVRQFLRILAIAPVIFGLLFLTSSSVSNIVFGGNAKAEKVGIAHPKRVVFVVFDEFPEMSLLDGSGHIDSQLYPNFSKFAGNATWYRNETTLAPYTEQAVPAILTGQEPRGRGISPVSSEYPNNLFTLLGKAYTMNVHEPVTRMCPANLCKSSSGSGFGGLISQSVKLWRSFASPHRTKVSFSFNDAAEASLGTGLTVAQQFIASLKGSTRPEIDYAHVELPHLPWQLLPTLQRYPEVPTLNVQWYDPAAAMVTHVRHLVQVQATDTLLGQMMDKLKSVGAYDDSLIIVTADHGVSFTNGAPIRAANRENYPQIMWPPLLIKYPGEQTAKVDDRPAQSLDIVPTIAQVLGAKVPWHLDGSSLLGPVKPDFPRRLYQYTAPGGLTPPSAEMLKPGEKYLTFDAGTGFPKVLAARPAPPGGDPALRMYRLGEFGGLVGKRASAYAGDPIKGGASIRDLAKFDDVDKSAPVVPWFYNQAFVGPIRKFGWVAISLNGTIAAVSPVSPLKAGGGFLEFLVPPQLIQNGKNKVEAYFVGGTRRAPVLSPVSVSSSTL